MNCLDHFFVEAIERGYASRHSAAIAVCVPEKIKHDWAAIDQMLNSRAAAHHLTMRRTYTVQGTYYELHRTDTLAETDGTQNHVH